MPKRTCPSCRATFEDDADPLGVCPCCGDSLAPPPCTVDPLSGVDLLQVAKRQRMLLWYILAMLCLQFSPFLMDVVGYNPVVDVVFPLVALIILITVIVGVVRLRRALGSGVVMCTLGAIVMLVPLVNLLALLRTNSRATNVLRSAGVRVGLMGADYRDVLRRLSLNICKSCGYDLTGNASGRCPECGEVFKLPSKPAPAPPRSLPNA